MNRESSCDQTKAASIQMEQAKFTADHLSDAQRVWLARWHLAPRGPGGEITNPYVGGWDKVNWNRMAERLEVLAILKAYTHGGYVFTDYGNRIMQWVSS